MARSVAFIRFLIMFLLAQSGLGTNLAKDIFLLGGGYNMAGQGGVRNSKWDGSLPKEVTPNPQILALNASHRWDMAREPLHLGVSEGPWGVGPGLSFAREVLAHNVSQSGVIGLVPCAKTSSTWILNWGRGKIFYNETVSRAKEAMQEGGTLRALLWYQGERDTILKMDVDGFKKRTERFFKDLRSDLNLPSLPILQVAIASGEGNFTEKIRKDQFAIKLPNVKVVDARGLALERDNLSLTTTSQVELGRKLARAFLGFPPLSF